MSREDVLRAGTRHPRIRRLFILVHVQSAYQQNSSKDPQTFDNSKLLEGTVFGTKRCCDLKGLGGVTDALRCLLSPQTQLPCGFGTTSLNSWEIEIVVAPRPSPTQDTRLLLQTSLRLKDHILIIQRLAVEGQAKLLRSLTRSVLLLHPSPFEAHEIYWPQRWFLRTPTATSRPHPSTPDCSLSLSGCFKDSRNMEKFPSLRVQPPIFGEGL